MMPENQVFRDQGWRITSKYGWRTHPVTGKRTFHRGVDMAKVHQAPVTAFTPGEVIHAGWGKTGTGLGNYGNVVAVWYENHLHIYAHLDSVSVSRGMKVKKGQVIGRQGRTPPHIVTGSHLHYEVRTARSPSFGLHKDINPGRYLTAWLKKEAEKEAEQVAGKHFKDVPDSAWYASAVNSLYEAGLIGGYDDGTFKPEQPLTRAEVAVLMLRIVRFLGKEV